MVVLTLKYQCLCLEILVLLDTGLVLGLWVTLVVLVSVLPMTACGVSLPSTTIH